MAGSGGQVRRWFSWKVWVSGIITVVLIVTFGAQYIASQQTKKIGEDEIAASKELEARLESYRKDNEVLPEPKDDGVAKLVDSFQKVEKSLKGFLSAKTVEEKKKFVRDVERVGPLMDLFYEKHDYEPEGFESLRREQNFERENMVISLVQTGDFISRQIAVQRFEEDGEEMYLVDWESWVGYCDFTPEEMRSQKPTEPFLVRAQLRLADYYNYGFSDDSKWHSYGLEVGEDGYVFLGYVPKGGEFDDKLGRMVRRSERCVLKVAYLKGSRAKDQVEIVEVIPSDGWVIGKGGQK